MPKIGKLRPHKPHSTLMVATGEKPGPPDPDLAILPRNHIRLRNGPLCVTVVRGFEREAEQSSRGREEARDEGVKGAWSWMAVGY